MKDVCDKHEISNCGECSGAAKRQDESLKDTPYWSEQQRRSLAVDSSDVEYGPEIIASFDGHCGRDGRAYSAGTVIRYSKTEAGWIAECCL